MKLPTSNKHLLLAFTFVFSIGCNVQNVPVSEIPLPEGVTLPDGMPAEIPVPIIPGIVTPIVPVPVTPVTPPASSSSGVNQYLNKACELTLGPDSNKQVRINPTTVGNKKVICIKAGLYSYIEVADLKGVGTPILVQNTGGLVETTGVMGIGDLKNVVISGSGTAGLEHGILIRDTGYRGAQLGGKFHTFTMQNIAFKNIHNYTIAWDRPSVTYDGTPDSAFYNNKFLRLKGEDVGTFIIFYADRDGRKDYIFNIEVAYCDVKNSPGMGSGIVLSSAFNVDIHHNRFENVSMDVNEHSGIIFLHGDGKVHHNYFKHTLGNSMRMWPLSFGSIGKLDMYNNISIDTIKYSMFEVQPFADALNAADMKATNVRIYHNTTGNINHGVGLPAGPALWTAGLVDTYNYNGGTIDIQNNVMFNINNPRDAANPMINGQGGWPADKFLTKNNLYFATSTLAGIADITTGKPSANSPVVSKAAALSLVTDDFAGKARPSGMVDLGAVQH